MKISAFLPITNPTKRGDTYIEAIKSHLFWADELIVVDGGSNDGSIETIKALNDNRIRIVERLWPQEDWSWAEFCKAWNRGLEEATGDWVAAGEADHIFHENEAARIREEVERETQKGRGVMKIQKLQSGDYQHWQSKAQMYYFIYKTKFPQIKYGFDPKNRTDLCHPIWHDGKSFIEGLPEGTAILETTPYAGLIGGTGANLYNYLWTFKTFEQVIKERMAANTAWNNFAPFVEIYNYKKAIDYESIKEEVAGQIAAVREKATRVITLENQPAVMHDKIINGLASNMVGAPQFNY